MCYILISTINAICNGQTAFGVCCLLILTKLLVNFFIFFSLSSKELECTFGIHSVEIRTGAPKALRTMQNKAVSMLIMKISHFKRMFQMTHDHRQCKSAGNGIPRKITELEVSRGIRSLPQILHILQLHHHHHNDHINRLLLK